MKNQHLEPRKNGWAVREELKKKASKLFKTKKEAIHYAREISDQHNVCTVEHNEDGKIKTVRCPPNSNISMFEVFKSSVY